MSVTRLVEASQANVAVTMVDKLTQCRSKLIYTSPKGTIEDTRVVPGLYLP